MVRRIALIFAGAVLIVSGMSVTNSLAWADGPTQRLADEVAAQTSGAPHCC